MLHSLVYRVEQVFLIDRRTGIAACTWPSRRSKKLRHGGGNAGRNSGFGRAIRSQPVPIGVGGILSRGIAGLDRAGT